MLGHALASAEEAVTPAGIESAFESVVCKPEVSPADTEIQVEWNYTNHWEIPLVVERFDTSCGCLKGNMSPEGSEPVAPGKSGVIRASFTPGSHRGSLRKSLHVRFVGHEKAVELVVEATVPSSVEVSGSDITWTSDGPAKSQSLDITSGTGTDFNLTALGGVTDVQFHITQETVEAKRHHRITITPAEGVSSGVHTLLVRTDSSDPRDRVVPVFLHIP